MPYECKMLNIKWCVYMYKVTYLDTTFLIGGLFALKKSIQDINFPTYIFHSLLCSLFSLVKEFVNKLVLMLVLRCGKVIDSVVTCFWFRFDAAVFAGMCHIATKLFTVPSTQYDLKGPALV